MATNEVGKIYERPWGSYRTLELATSYQVKIIIVNADGRLSLQKHAQRSEHWFILEGNPRITVAQETRFYQPGEAISIPQGAIHRLENFTSQEIKIIEIQRGSYLGEDDIVRLEDSYGRPVSSPAN